MSDKKACIVGLGYVGFPLACLAAKKHQVTGIDTDKAKVEKINAGECPIKEHYLQQLFTPSSFAATTDFSAIKSADIIVICVPTPIDEKQQPDLGPLKKAAEAVAQFLQRGQLVVIESTVYPGTCEEVVIPIFEKLSTLIAGKDFDIAYCPERIDPGNRNWTLENIPRVLGALTRQGAERAYAFYTAFIAAEVKPLSTIKAAEATKILENTFRDINIAFINEMAMSFDALGIDITEVIKGASTKPFAFMPHYPGPGVGGHCIPVDPYYLIERAKLNNFSHRFLSLAREINNSMPEYVFKTIQNELNTLGQPVKSARIGVLGYAYKKNVGDVRESPAIRILQLLKEHGAAVALYDPHVPQQSTHAGLPELLNAVDHLVIVTDHKEFTEMDYALLQENNIRLVVDARNCLDKEKIESRGIRYKGIGR